ncbi:putative glucose uptake permease [Weissella oryzae SG25]|uniref:Putative glucose uptake permease n=1 Tax=Weissella oryzae (strain DSM 25784 / JCM 18191 / LMG 30913 / SG25) TaxID=1329250 RepID=A0A069CW09_WEIOS|nr:GRP family sugar transporter [Weissella oryzae]GAK31403.1 putative glucose uptake permease [Weissella oryzae SG25]
MSILIALIPAIAWGSVGIVTTKMGGSAAQGTLGMTIGALVFGLGTMLIYVLPVAGSDYAFNPKIWVVGVVSGLFWAVGTAGQFIGFKKLGVSIGNPISTAGQIIFNAIMAAAVLGDWTSSRMWLFGLIAIAMVALGAYFTSIPDANAPKQMNIDFSWSAGLLAMLISTLGYMMYFVFPNLLAKIGYISASLKAGPHGSADGLYYMTSIVGPQSIGQVVGALIIVIFFMKEREIFAKATWRNVVTGLVWAVGNVFMFISAANPKIGQATAATLSQMGIIVGVFGSIWILGERKSKRQMVFIIIGVILVALGGVVISNLANI